MHGARHLPSQLGEHCGACRPEDNAWDMCGRAFVHFMGYRLGDRRILSGPRDSASAFIYVYLAALIADCMPVYRATNDAVLRGGDRGRIHPRYIMRVANARNQMHVVLSRQRRGPRPGLDDKLRAWAVRLSSFSFRSPTSSRPAWTR